MNQSPSQSSRLASPLRLLAALALVASIPLGSPAAETRSSEELVIEENEVIEDDLYAFAERIVIKGTIQGDLIAAGKDIEVFGTVNGDAMLAGQTILLDGVVTDDVRMAGQILQMRESARVGGDVMSAGMTLECFEQSDIQGQLYWMGQSARLAGSIGSDLIANTDALAIEGKVGGDCSLGIGGGGGTPPTYGPPPALPMPRVDKGLTITSAAQIDGDLAYESPREAAIEDPAVVQGDIQFEQHVAEQAEGKDAATVWIERGWSAARRYAGLLIVGAVLLLLVPGWTGRLSNNVRTRPLASVGWGLLSVLFFAMALFVIGLLAVMLAVIFGIATFGDLVAVALIGGGLLSSLLVGSFWIYTSYVAQVVVGLALGRLLFGAESRWPGFLLGVLLLVVCLYLPYVGIVAGFLTILLGLGALWLRPATSAAESPAATEPSESDSKPAMA